MARGGRRRTGPPLAGGRRRRAPGARTRRWGAVLPRRFYERLAPVVAVDLLGCVLVSRVRGRITAGRIVETEAYLGPEDLASHAAFRPSSRALFYGPGGVAYVFSAYGLHACLNAIAGSRGIPGCVLIRALEPLAGLDVMARRRGRPELAHGLHPPRALAALTSGPARLTEAFGITVRDSGRDLRQGRLTIHAGSGRAPRMVAIGRRIGITRARDSQLRYWVPDSPFVSVRATVQPQGPRHDDARRARSPGARPPPASRPPRQPRRARR